MKRLFLLVLLIPAFLISCQKEEIKTAELDDFVSDLELKVESDDGEDPPCYRILFPLGVVMPNGDIVDGDDRRELMKNIKSWMKDNRKVKRKRLSFNYPIDVNFKGDIITLDSEKQLDRVRMACKGYDDKDRDKTPCIEMVYPVSYLLPSGRTLTANSGVELRRMMTVWKENNPDSKERPKMVFPVEVKFKGKELTVENEKQMMRIKNACAGDKDDGEDEEACFKLVYPLTYEVGDSQITGNSKKEIKAAIKQWYKDHPDSKKKKAELLFPIQIRYETERGERIVEVADREALKKAYEDCGK